MEQEQQVEEQISPAKTINADEILQASLKLFAKKGYFNTSLTDIKDAVGFKTTNSLHTVFKTKQAIAQALQEHIVDSLNISIDDIRRRNRKSSEQLREIVDLLFKLTDEAPEIVYFLLFINSNEFLPEQPPISESMPFQKIKRIIQAGIKEGEIRTLDPILAYTYFFGIIQLTISQIISGALPKSAEHYQSQVWLAAWSSIAKK